MNRSRTLVRKLIIIALPLALAASNAPLPARGKTPYEAQIAGWVAAVLQSLITGEFAGRRPSQADATPTRPICKARDYSDLQAVANDRVAFDAFHRRCDLIETKIDETHVHSIAHLPAGYCETLKKVFETALADQVLAPPQAPGDWVVIEYKGSRYAGSNRDLPRGARLQAVCEPNGAIRISAPRQRK